MISDEDVKRRLRFVRHKGKVIFVADFSGATEDDMVLLLDQVRVIVAGHEPGSVLSLADLTGAHVDKAVATKIKEVLVRDRPYVKRSAWVGTESLPNVFYEHFKSFSQRELPTFKTRDEAMEWLVAG